MLAHGFFRDSLTTLVLRVFCSQTYSCPQNWETFRVGSFGSLMTGRDLPFVLRRYRDLQTWLGQKVPLNVQTKS